MVKLNFDLDIMLIDLWMALMDGQT